MEDLDSKQTLDPKEAKRTLASIQKIESLEPIEGADFIELAHIMGWKCVVKKGEFQVGDLCVYFEVDSFLPELPQFEFLRKGSFRDNEHNGQGFRVKSTKLRGQISQGLALSDTAFPELEGMDLTVGMDVTELLSVKKWYTPEVTGNLGTSAGSFPTHITRKTDEERIQSNKHLLGRLEGQPYYNAVKYDGTSVTVVKSGEDIQVCSRNLTLKQEDSSIWDFMLDSGIIAKLVDYTGDIVFKGEYYGTGIGTNLLGLTGKQWAVFTIEKDDFQLGLIEFLETAKEFGLETVAIDEIGGCNEEEVAKITALTPVSKIESDTFSETVDSLLDKAKGRYKKSGKHREGLVTRPIASQKLPNTLSFKAINNDYLLKLKD